MDLPRIGNLDLRNPEIAYEIDNYGIYWDWPKFPADTLTFINTGVRPSQSRRVLIRFRVNVGPMQEAVDKAIIAAEKAWAEIRRTAEEREAVSTRGW